MKKENPSENDWSGVFASRVLTLMEKRGLTRSDIARCCGISKQQVSNYLSGNSRPSIECVIRLANMAQVSVDYLLGATGEGKASSAMEKTAELEPPLLEAEEQILLKKFRSLPRKKQRALLSLIKVM